MKKRGELESSIEVTARIVKAQNLVLHDFKENESLSERDARLVDEAKGIVDEYFKTLREDIKRLETDGYAIQFFYFPHIVFDKGDSKWTE